MELSKRYRHGDILSICPKVPDMGPSLPVLEIHNGKAASLVSLSTRYAGMIGKSAMERKVIGSISGADISKGGVSCLVQDLGNCQVASRHPKLT